MGNNGNRQFFLTYKIRPKVMQKRARGDFLRKKTKKKIQNKIFPSEIWFLRKSSLKIC